MKASLTILQKKKLDGTTHHLPASKSISNRVLIIDALAGGGSVLNNLSDANDTQLMIRLIKSEDETIDVEDAGTTMRFLTSFFALSDQCKILTGTERMKERPIKLLVEALHTLGAEIEYLGKDGYPPIRTVGFKGQKVTELSIRGDVSSQYISSIMMAAPMLPQGLKINLTGKIGSRPYIEMTLSLMKLFGAQARFEGANITVEPGRYRKTEFFVESDWSGASYWFAFAAMADDAVVSLPRISLQSLQGDRAIVDIMANLGVKAEMKGGLLELRKHGSTQSFRWDFTHCPDLAQTVAVVCAAKGVPAIFTGLESLRIKETDRISALQNELKKIGADLLERNSEWELVPSTSLPAQVTFETYKDHRMAMAFAPLATLMVVTIINPGVVKKSYPKYWDDLKSFGFTVEVT